jgi:hypothetical protein
MRPDSQSGCRRSWVRKIKRLPRMAHLSRRADQPHGGVGRALRRRVQEGARAEESDPMRFKQRVEGDRVWMVCGAVLVRVVTFG